MCVLIVDRGIHRVSEGKAALPSAHPFANFKQEDEMRLHSHVSIYQVGRVQPEQSEPRCFEQGCRENKSGVILAYKEQRWIVFVTASLPARKRKIMLPSPLAMITTPSLCVQQQARLGTKLPRGVPCRSQTPGRRRLIRDALVSGRSEHTSSRMCFQKVFLRLMLHQISSSVLNQVNI